MQAFALFATIAAAIQIYCRSVVAQNFKAELHVQVQVQDGFNSDLTYVNDSLQAPADPVSADSADTTTAPALEVPSAVYYVLAIPGSPGELNVTWTPPLNGSASVTGYVVSWMCSADQGEIQVDKHTYQHIICRLTPCTECNVTVKWTASDVEDTNSPTTFTASVGPSEAPIRYSDYEVIGTTVFVTWPSRYLNCIMNYAIFWKRANIANDTITETKGDNMAQLGDVQYAFEDVPILSIFSYCMTDRGSSATNYSVGNTVCQTVVIDGRPPAPTNISMSAITPGYLTVWWDPAVDNYGVFEKFIVKLINEETKIETVSNVFSSTPLPPRMSKQFQNLMRGVKFTVVISQVNNYGEGLYSDPASIVTAE